MLHLQALTSEVSVEVMKSAHLELQFVPHGFLKGFPLRGGLSKVFIGLWHQLDLCFQLPTDTRQKEYTENYAFFEQLLDLKSVNRWPLSDVMKPIYWSFLCLEVCMLTMQINE